MVEIIREMMYNIAVVKNPDQILRRKSMKKILSAAVAAIILAGITACSAGSVQDAAVSRTENSTTVSACGISITFDSDWTVYTGDSVYEYLLGEEDRSVEDMRESYEEIGMAYLFYATNSDESAFMSLTSLKITADETTGETLTNEEYARSNHDTSVFSYQAAGLSIRNSSFDTADIGGESGWLSHYELYKDEETSQLLLGQSEFIYEEDSKFCSLQSYYHTEAAAQQTDEIIAGISAK